MLVEEAVGCLKPDSTPGFPWSLRFVTNKDLLKSANQELVTECCVRLEKILFSEEMPTDPVEIYKQNFHGLVTPFEKWEPHPPRKAKNGKWRIVNCLSVVDQVVERVLFTPAVKAVKASYPVSGAVVGIGFSDDHVKHFAKEVTSTPHLGWSSDVGGWERSLDASYVKEASENLIRNMESFDNDSILVRAIRRHAHMITNPVFIVSTPDYSLYELVVRENMGGMLSGSYMTTLYNTMCRLDVSYLAGIEKPRAAGDDCLDGTKMSKDALSKGYSKLGYTLRDVEPITRDKFSFCSHTFRCKDGKWSAQLESWPKALFKTLTRPLTPEREAAFHYEMRNNDNYQAMVNCINEFGRFVPDDLELPNKDVVAKFN